MRASCSGYSIFGIAVERELVLKWRFPRENDTFHSIHKVYMYSENALALTVRVILETLLERYAEHDGHFERSLKRRRVFVLFDRNNRLPRDADAIGELLLRYLSSGSEFPNLIAYSGHQSVFQ